jgi:hypothetical protein
MHCKQVLNKDVEQYVVIDKGTDRHPEVLAHTACEQKRPSTFGIDDWLRTLRWPGKR